MTQHTLIVGGGAVGLSVAWELSRRGDRVTLLEREKSVGKATSWSAAGILPAANLQSATDPLDQLRGLSHRLFPLWADDLKSITQIDCGYRQCGGWYLANTPGERASMSGMTRYWQELGIDCQPVSAGQLADREPALAIDASESCAAWWVPDECQVRSPDYLRALDQACRVSGAEVIEQANVEDLRWNDQEASVQVGERWMHADRIVLCGGAWTGRIAAVLRLDASIVPVRGQILMLKTAQPLLRSIVNVGHRYVLCRDDGHTIIGSCEEEVGFQLGTSDDMLLSLKRFAVDLVPKLAGAAVAASWSGLRPMTFDGFPMIGRLPQTENVFVAAGHFRSGLHLSPATAVTLADLMNGHTPEVDLDAFRVGKQQEKFPHSHRFVHD